MKSAIVFVLTAAGVVLCSDTFKGLIGVGCLVVAITIQEKVNEHY